MGRISLANYCPTKKSQYRATCYAHAVVYTAMGIELNIKLNISDPTLINNRYLVPGVIASFHNGSLPLRARSPRCGRKGTAAKALDLLVKFGTVSSDVFMCDCLKVNKIKRKIPKNANWYKITGYEAFTNNNRENPNAIRWIISALEKSHPVICTIYQFDEFKNIKSEWIDNELPPNSVIKTVSNSKNGRSNHVVCIVGFDDNYNNSGSGYFLVKNNYLSWGDNGFSWIPYSYFSYLINELYYIQDIVIENKD
jgi:hypothetical protein